MILIHGEIIENTEYQEAIKSIRKKIVETLSKKPLSVEAVIRGAQRLVEDLGKGMYDRELYSFVDNPEEIRKEIVQLAFLFEKEYLQQKHEFELGQWKNNIEKEGSLRVVPLGVLLHIAAGNMEALPVFSVIEGLLAGNINLLKLPSADGGLSVFLIQKLMEYEPLLKEYIYVFDTPSTDFTTIVQLMELANGIVVWGGEQAVQAVRSHAPLNTKIIEWGHKISFAYLYNLEVPTEKLVALAKHLLETKQLLCSSCQIIYLNTTDFEKVKQFGQNFALLLGQLEGAYEIPLPLQGKLTLEFMAKELEQILQENPREVLFRNQRTSVTCKEDGVLEISLLYGNVLVKPLPEEKIYETLYYERGYLQTVGLYPKTVETVERFLRLGVTNIKEIDTMSEIYHHRTHDGELPLRVYSRIVEC